MSQSMSLDAVRKRATRRGFQLLIYVAGKREAVRSPEYDLRDMRTGKILTGKRFQSLQDVSSELYARDR